MKNKTILKVSFVALFAAIICVGCFIRIPLGVIPIVLQNMLCILCGVLLGGIWAGAPTALFLLALPLMAAHVEPETAQKVAMTFLNNNGGLCPAFT